MTMCDGSQPCCGILAVLSHESGDAQTFRLVPCERSGGEPHAAVVGA